MNGETVVGRAIAGDVEAFAELMRSHQEAAVRYARAILHDEHLAEDAVQEALAAAYLALPGLRDHESFASWLRGIVRFQCYRILRRRHAALVSLDHALHVPDTGPNPEDQVEQREQADTVRHAVAALPDSHRAVVSLYYFGGRSQREVAMSLDMPLTTVNNRLHAARKGLKGGLAMIANDGIQGTPAAESASDSGTVVAVHGSLFDVQFPANRVPPIFAAIEFIDAGGRGSATGQVIAILEASVVRCVPVIERRLPAVGSSVANLHSAAQTPVSAGSVRSAAAALIDEIAHGSADLSDARLLETGIKVIDLFCPVNKGGSIGIIGDAGAGRIVIAAEILRNATEQNDSLSILTFMQAGQEAHMLMGDKELANAHGPRQTAYFAIDEPRDLSSASVKAASSQLEATVVAARSLGLEGLWPAVDPLRSSSRILAGDAVSEEHRHLAERSRDLLRAYSELKERTHPDDVEALSREDRLTWDRARRLQNFLTQPFFVAEPYTNVPGQRISLADTLAGVTAILDGKTDALPEDALLFTGTLEDAVDRAAR